MFYFNLALDIWTEDIKNDLLEISERMGWRPEIKDNELLLTVPQDDGGMFDLIFSEFM